jgi:glycerol-3-phosphate acyltransferase PlsX
LKSITIAIDAMGGDHGVKSTIPAAVSAVKRFSQLQLILVGNEKTLTRALRQYKAAKHPRITIEHASEVVAMDESPALVLRNKKDSSMRIAINLVKEGRADACVSAGNTGALMATSRFVLKMLPGVDRPAIIYAFPGVNHQTGETHPVHMLDLGANVDCSAEHLFQFGVMGSIHHACIHPEHGKPRVALLNIGEEDMKGLEIIKQAAKMLGECESINYIGFVEGNDLLRDKADVIVCDGFIGNIALKTVEGTASHIAYHVKAVFKSSLMARVLSVFALPILLKLRNKLDNRRYNGASLIGLKGIVIKSHGGADKVAFLNAIVEAVKEVEQDIPSKIHHQIADLLGQESH